MKPTNKLMKRLSLYLFLIFFTLQTPSWADDIRDFEIEGMSLGDSALDYFSENEIKNNTKKYYDDMTNFPFVAIEIYQHSLFKNYSGVQFHVKKNDKKYKIYSISGYDFYDNDIKGCYKKQDEIEKEIFSMFNEVKKKNWGILVLNLQGEATEGSTYKPISFDFNTGDRISISCYHYSNTPQIDNLKITLTSKEFKEYLKEDAVPANN